MTKRKPLIEMTEAECIEKDINAMSRSMKRLVVTSLFDLDSSKAFPWTYVPLGLLMTDDEAMQRIKFDVSRGIAVVVRKAGDA